MERTWFTFHCWLYNLCIVVYVTNKTWNLKLNPPHILDLVILKKFQFRLSFLPRFNMDFYGERPVAVGQDGG